MLSVRVRPPLRNLLNTLSCLHVQKQQDKRALTVDVAIENAANGVGQGPHWDEASKTLLHVDVLEGEVHRWDYRTGDDEKIRLGSSASFLMPRRVGGYIVGLGRTISHLDWDTKVITKLQEVEQGEKTRFNDGMCDAVGRLWAGTMTADHITDPSRTGMGNFYSLELDGSLRVHREGTGVSNGPVWSPDYTIMYHIDSAERKVFAYDFDAETETLTKRRTCIDFGGPGTINRLGYPDGMTIDTDGKLWIACNGVGKVIRFDPVTGNQMTSITLPVSGPTACCFGGSNMDELFITSSKFELSTTNKSDNPLAGSVFRVTGLDVKGMPVNCFHG